jgi:hypothetical protein
MGTYHTFQDKPVLGKSIMINTNNVIHNKCEMISHGLGENFEGKVYYANGPETFHVTSTIFLRDE